MTEPPQAPGGPDWGDMKGKMMAARGPDRLILIAGVLFLVDSFLPWGKVSFGLISANIKGWSAGGLAVLSILFALAALALSGITMAGMKMTMPVKTGMLFMVFGVGSLVFALLRMLTWPTGIGSAFGIFIAIILGGVLAYAGWMKSKAEKAM